MNKQQIIIFEGHDMSGKTTIAKQLSAKLNIPYFKHNKNGAWWDPIVSLLYSSEPILQLIEQTGMNIIIDRFHGSEYAYSKAFNRQSLPEIVQKIDNRFAEMNAKIIICEKDSIAYQEDDGHIAPVDKYDSIKEAYRDFARHSACDVLILDTTTETLDLQIEQICQFCMKS